MGRPLLIALFGVLLVMVASWALGEWLRQRKEPSRPSTTEDAEDTE